MRVGFEVRVVPVLSPRDVSECGEGPCHSVTCIQGIQDSRLPVSCGILGWRRPREVTDFIGWVSVSNGERQVLI